jgi:DNA-binding PadR family transcriptional regulator
VLQKTKLQILELLTKEPLHGYGLAKRLKVSISSIYSHLNELEDKGFIQILKKEEKRVYYVITERGRSLLSLLK